MCGAWAIGGGQVNAQEKTAKKVFADNTYKPTKVVDWMTGRYRSI